MKTLDLGNNESVSRGMRTTANGYVALTYCESKHFKTERGAINWLKRRSINPDGSYIK